MNLDKLFDDAWESGSDRVDHGRRIRELIEGDLVAMTAFVTVIVAEPVRIGERVRDMLFLKCMELGADPDEFERFLASLGMKRAK